MISLNTLRVIPHFAFELPANTEANAVRPDTNNSDANWMSINKKIWIRKNFNVENKIYSDSGKTVARVIFSPGKLKFGHVGKETEKDWKQSTEAKALMAEVLEAILGQLQSAAPSPEAMIYAEASLIPALDWAVGSVIAGGDEAGAVNRARLTALQAHATQADIRPASVETDLSNEPVADFVSRRLCTAFSQIPRPAPAQVEINFRAEADTAQIVWRMDGEFDLLWGCSFIGIEDDLVVIRQRPAAEERRLRKLGALRFLLTQACALERTLGAFDEPIKLELKINSPSIKLDAVLRIAPSGWGFDIVRAGMVTGAENLPSSFRFTCQIGNKSGQVKYPI